MSNDFDLWRKELLQTGGIVQDGDTSVPQEVAEKRFNRYVEMVEAVSGQEGIEAFMTLIESLQAKDDYGAYETTYRALWRFPPGVVAHGLVAALPRLIQRQPDRAGTHSRADRQSGHDQGSRYFIRIPRCAWI